MADSHFISDGQERPFYIKGRPGYYPELRGKYRPFGVREQLAWNSRASRVPADEIPDFEAATVAEKLVSWSAPMPATVENILKLDSELYLRLVDIVTYSAK